MRTVWTTLGLASLTAIALSGCAAQQTLRGDSFSLGRNATLEPCTASRAFHDPTIKSDLDKSWSITCRNVAASRALGYVRQIDRHADRAPFDAALTCGDYRPAMVEGIGEVQARRCFDTLLNAPVVNFIAPHGRLTFLVSAAEGVLGPAEEAVRIIAGRAVPLTDAGRQVQPGIKVADLAAVRGGPTTAAMIEFDSNIALTDGINLNHKGLYIQASRVLNDALSRLPAKANPALKAELLLEAGLADSNIKFSESATEHFNEADTLLLSAAGPNLVFLQRKRDAYRALDLLNQRRFRAALAALDRLVSAPAPVGQPLRDAATVRLLNQPAPGSGVSSSIAVPETAALQQAVLDAQASWARSVAMLALGDLAGSQVALARAQTAYAPLLNEHIDPTLILWLGAHIDRQQGRLQARAHNYDAAIVSFDKALVGLRRGALNTAGTGTEPTIAETSLERAGIIADQGGNPANIRREYELAIDALVRANESSGGATLPTGVERYLDLLVADSAKNATPETYERFFRAVQSVGEPAVARQLSQLQSVVTADPAIGVKVRDRAELERTVTSLRYQIQAQNQAGQSTAALDQQRQVAEAKLLQIETELGASAKYSSIDDKPATIAELRQALRPGEGFWKVIQFNRRAYGLFVNANQTYIYSVVAPKAVLDTVSQSVRTSIDGHLDQDHPQLVPFDVVGAYTLFSLLSGPASDAILKSTALVIDPAGPLQNLPAAVLVTDRASVDRYVAATRAAVGAAAKQTAAFDTSNVSFLAMRSPISTAVSPRSFLVARALPPSKAKNAFLGIGEHMPAPALNAADQVRQVQMGFGCTVKYAKLAEFSHLLAPINREELVIASTALGQRNAPEMVGAAFSDTAVEARTDLADFEVIHFATHGLQEGVWAGCDQSPPALVTSFGDGNSDGLLSFSEVAGLRLDANLVVLSACETASGVKSEALARRSGQEEAGSTLEGLVRAFLTANSRAVLATFWSVSADNETNDLIKTFYTAARRQSIGGALQTAQEGLISRPQFSHPFYWGAYFVVGDSTKNMLSGTRSADAAPGIGTHAP